MYIIKAFTWFNPELSEARHADQVARHVGYESIFVLKCFSIVPLNFIHGGNQIFLSPGPKCIGIVNLEENKSSVRSGFGFLVTHQLT